MTVSMLPRWANARFHLIIRYKFGEDPDLMLGSLVRVEQDEPEWPRSSLMMVCSVTTDDEGVEYDLRETEPRPDWAEYHDSAKIVRLPMENQS